jgi:hypothetical protein
MWRIFKVKFIIWYNRCDERSDEGLQIVPNREKNRHILPTSTKSPIIASEIYTMGGRSSPQ